MRYVYIGFFTLTDAQRARDILERRSIRSRVARMPSGPGVSCAFGLKLPGEYTDKAREVITESGMRMGKTVYRRENGDHTHDLL